MYSSLSRTCSTTTTTSAARQRARSAFRLPFVEAFKSYSRNGRPDARPSLIVPTMIEGHLTTAGDHASTTNLSAGEVPAVATRQMLLPSVDGNSEGMWLAAGDSTRGAV